MKSKRAYDETLRETYTVISVSVYDYYICITLTDS